MRVRASIALLCVVAVQFLQAQSVEVILDASGSMNAPLDATMSRIAAAREALENVVVSLPDETRIAFRAYGHQSPRAKHDCTDTAILSPFATLASSRAKIVAASKKLTVQGYTPITYVLGLAAKDLTGQAGRHTIILVSDGKETCDGDPCALARALREADTDLVIHTVGLGVDTAARSELRCIAAATGGSYFDAKSSAQLVTALKDAVVAPPKMPPALKKGIGKLRISSTGSLATHQVRDAAGKEVAVLNSADTETDLPAGIYSVTFGPYEWRGIEVRGTETTTISPALLHLDGLIEDAKAVDVESGVVVATFTRMTTRAALLPGTYSVLIGQAEWPDVRVEGGVQTTLKLAQVEVTGLVTLGSATIVDASGKLVASINHVNSRASLPPGRYRVKFGSRSKDINLAEGERIEVSAK